MKKIFKKLLICILIVLVLNNFFIGSASNPFIPVSYASTGDFITGILGSVVGLLTLPIRLVAIGIAFAVNTLMAGVAYIEGAEDGTASDEGSHTSLTPYDVLFNKIKLININFFDLDGLSEDSILYKFRTAISLWYYAMRTIASAILLVILIYVGIRMALSTVSAEQKASYKKMMVDWVVSLAIIFVMQYIMLFAIYVNDALVGAIEVASAATSTDMSKSIDAIAAIGLKIVAVESIAATIVYCMLVFQTFGLFVSYFNRMLKLAFLTIISPLITLTYSIDKMGDGKAQALNTWLKEYIFTILIQPFHCIIYMAFINVALELLTDASGTEAIACSIIAILCVKFIRTAEDLVRKIFAFADDNKDTSLGAGMAVATIAASKAKNIGKSTRKAVNGLKNFGGTAGGTLTNARVEAIALGRMLRGNNVNKSTGEKQSFSDVKSDVRTEILDKKAEKVENKKYGVSHKNTEVEKEINERAKALQEAGMNQNEARAQARLAIAKEKRKKNRSEEFNKKHKTISKARGAVNTVRKAAQQSETLRELGNIAKTTAGIGAGLAIGAGYYGASGKGMESFMTGVATFRGTTEFLKSTGKTLRTDVTSRLDSLGASSKAEAASKLNEIIANADKYEGKDELDKIMKELEKALEQASVDGKVKTRIKNTIEKTAALNPSASISSLVNNALVANGIKEHQMTDGLKNSTTKLADFTQSKGIYNAIKNAGELGTSADTFVGDVLKSYIPAGGGIETGGRKTSQEFLQESKNITSNMDGKEEKFIAPDDDTAKEFVDSRNDRDIEEFYKDCEKEMNKIQKDLSDDTLSEREKEALIAELNQVEAAKAKVQDLALERAVEDLRRQYQDLLDEATKATEKDAKKIVDRQLADLQGQYNKYIKEADEQISRKEVEGAKTEAEINTQKIALKQDLANIQTLRGTLK